MMSSLRRLGALVGAAALVLGLAACNDLTSSPTSSAVDYAACATDDSELQNQNVDRTGKGSFPDVTGDDTPVIAAGKGTEPTSKVLVKTLKQGDGALVCPGAHTHVGDRLELVIPASLGYGNQARGNIPANSTLVFVVDVLGTSTTNMADESVLTGATATGEALPAGVTVTGDPGTEPTLTIDETVAPPTERATYTIYKGSGETLTEGQNFLYKYVVGAFGANGQTQSSWSQNPQSESAVEAELVGYTVGSRVLVVIPLSDGSAQSGQSGAAQQVNILVVDIVGTSTME